jgi:hypothetical protein
MACKQGGVIVYIYLEVRTNQMRRIYEGELVSLEHFSDHMLIRIKKAYGKGAIVSARHEDVAVMHILPDAEAVAA